MSREDCIRHIFHNRGQTITVRQGEFLLRKDVPNDKLFWVRKGELICRNTPSLYGGPGALLGLQSFYHRNVHAHLTLEALEDTEVSFIEASEFFASKDETLQRDLTRLIVLELGARNEKIRELEKFEARQEQKIREMASLAVLGELSAGVAHEINNAFAVIARGVDWLEGTVAGHYKESKDKLKTELFLKGQKDGRKLALNSEEQAHIRQLSKELHKKFKIDFSTARLLAKLPLDDEFIFKMAKSKKRQELIDSWETGATLRDLERAASQTSHVVRSMRELGARNEDMEEEIDLSETLENALSILQSPLKGISVNVEAQKNLSIKGNAGMLIQVWINIIKNACDAMSGLKTNEGIINIKVNSFNGIIAIDLSNNGPQIPPEILPEIFKPNVTTKKNGLSFGLGIGLTFVKRIIDEHGGSVSVESSEKETIFHIKIPSLNTTRNNYE